MLSTNPQPPQASNIVSGFDETVVPLKDGLVVEKNAVLFPDMTQRATSCPLEKVFIGNNLSYPQKPETRKLTVFGEPQFCLP